MRTIEDIYIDIYVEVPPFLHVLLSIWFSTNEIVEYAKQGTGEVTGAGGYTSNKH